MIELKEESSNAEQVELREKTSRLEEQVEILEKQLETLHPELAQCQQRIEQLGKEKVEIENNMKAQLDDKSKVIKELQLSSETLQKENESL